MNQGGEPGHDDYGLPSVDIQVPDDARDLYRDVQAYHRELRALRRQERSKRWREPLRKSSLVLPVIAGLLVLAMLGGMILTVFSANPNLTGLPGPLDGPRSKPHASGTPAGSAVTSRPADSTASAAAGRGVSLPSRPIVVSAHGPFTLRTPTTAAIAVMPARCRCSSEIKRLLIRARSADVTVYFDGSGNSGLAALSGLSPTVYDGTAVLAIDAHSALAKAFPPRRLEILLVDSHGAVTVTSGLQPQFWTKQELSALKPPR